MAAKWIDALASVAPAAATMLGGPLAGTAVKALTKVFGLGEDASESDLEKAVLTMSPEQMLEAKRVDADLKKAMAQAGVDLEKIAQEDRVSARVMAQSTGSNVPAILLAVTAIMFGGCLVAIFLGHMSGLPPEDKSLINYALGQIGGWVGAGITFYFGSTAGSQKKDNLLYESEPFNG